MLSTAPRKEGADLSGAFARMLRCARSTAGSARPPPSRKPPLWGPRGKGTVPAGKSARSNVFPQILGLSQDFRMTSDLLPSEGNSTPLLRGAVLRTSVVLPIALMMCACEPGGEAPPPPAAPQFRAGPPPPGATPAPGVVEGRILFRGEVPADLREPIVPTPCGDEAGPEKLLVSREGGVENAVVVVEAPAPAAPQPPGGLPAVTIDNRGCRFVPRVQVARRGAPLRVKNSDAVFHNVRGSGAHDLNLGLAGGAASDCGPL